MKFLICLLSVISFSLSHASFFNIDTGIGRCRTKGPFAGCTSPQGALECILEKNKIIYDNIMGLSAQSGVRFSVQGVTKNGYTKQEGSLVISPNNPSQKGFAFTTDDVNCMSNLHGVVAKMERGHLTFDQSNRSEPQTYGMIHSKEEEFGVCRVHGPWAKCESPEAALRCMILKDRQKYNEFVAAMQTGGVDFSLSPLRPGEGFFDKKATLIGRPLSDRDKQSIIWETDDPNCMGNLAGKTGTIDTRANFVFTQSMG